MRGQNSTFSEHGHVAYQIKENHEGSNYVAIILPADLSQTLGMRSVGQNSTFSEHVNVAYQINENQECSNMVAKILTADWPPPTPPPPTPLPQTLGKRSVGQNSTFPEHVNVAYQINEIQECSNMVANILPADLPQTLGIRPTLEIFLFPLTRPCLTGMGRSVVKLFYFTSQTRYPLNLL